MLRCVSEKDARRVAALKLNIPVIYLGISVLREIRAEQGSKCQTSFVSGCTHKVNTSIPRK